jgi:hypothetical protein
MRCPLSIALALVITGPALAADGAPKTRPRVLYIGNTDTDRGRAYSAFLRENFVFAGAVDRKALDPGSPPAVDVVMLDWSQQDIDRRIPPSKPSLPEIDLKSPLGERSRWTRPTVLLGSAGHLLAAPWKVFGGAG